MILNRNDEPDPMAATRPSGGCSGTLPNSTKIPKCLSLAGGSAGRSPPEGSCIPLSNLQNLVPLLPREGLLELLNETSWPMPLVSINRCDLRFSVILLQSSFFSRFGCPKRTIRALPYSKFRFFGQCRTSMLARRRPR